MTHIPNQKIREAILLLLYTYQFNDEERENLTKLICKELKLSKSNFHLAEQEARLIDSEKESLDKELGEVTTSYSIERVHLVEKLILRIALSEMRKNTLSPNISISEACRLGKKFATPSSTSFLNAVLDELSKKTYNREKGTSD